MDFISTGICEYSKNNLFRWWKRQLASLPLSFQAITCRPVKGRENPPGIQGRPPKGHLWSTGYGLEKPVAVRRHIDKFKGQSLGLNANNPHFKM